jgi:hypothetical protein
MNGTSIFGSWLDQALGAPGFATNAGGEAAAYASLELPKQLQRASESALWSAQNLGVTGTALANQANFKVYSTAAGNSGQGFTPMTIAETNLKENGRIPSGAAYGVYGIAGQVYTINANNGLATSPPVATDLWNLTTNCVLQWDFLSTTIDICPLSLAGAGGGVFGSTADTGATEGTNASGSRVSLNNGAGQVWIYQFLPVLLPASTTFGIKLLFGGSAAPVNVNAEGGVSLVTRIVLLGTYRTALPVG